MSDPSPPLLLDRDPEPLARAYLWLIAGLAGLGFAVAVMLAVGTQASRDAERLAGGGGYGGVLAGALATRWARATP